LKDLVVPFEGFLSKRRPSCPRSWKSTSPEILLFRDQKMARWKF